MKSGPRIYNLFPPLVGPVAVWTRHLDRIAAMGFDWIFLNPFHETGFSGSLYAVKDYFRLNALLRGDARVTDDALLAGFVAAAARRGLNVMMDVVLNHTAKDSLLAQRNPDWFRREVDGRLASPYAVDPDDAAKVTVWGDLAEIDYAERPVRADIVAFWRDFVAHYAGLGFRGFRGDAAYKVPAEVWRAVIDAGRATRNDAVFFAETLGGRPNEIMALSGAGFDYIFNSAKWWDFHAPWLMEQYEAYRRIAPSIAFPESHDTERLATDLARAGVTDLAAVEAAYRQRYLFAAAFSTGLMMPVGYEFGFTRKLDVVATRPEDWEEPRFDLSEFVAETNGMKAAVPALNEEGPQSLLKPDGAAVCALLRTGAGETWALTFVNADAGRAHTVASERIATLGVPLHAREVTPGHCATRLVPGARLRLAPAEVRVFVPDTHTVAPAIAARPLQSREIVIQNVTPELDGGRYPVKRETGDMLEVWADVFKEGHGKLAAVLKHRRRDEVAWHETPMRLVEPGLDRWSGAVPLEENARYLYTIEAWPDAFESWCDEVEKKRVAGQDVAIELIEGRALVEAARGRSQGADAERLARVLVELDHVASDEERAVALLAPTLRALMARVPDRGGAVTYNRELEVTVDRIATRFAAWYEMFPRSQGLDPSRSATFADCIARLDEIRDMGFDVVYLVPIHPIGRTHRKGRNNALEAGPGDPGSPYAIGAAEGGHDAVHPELGTLADFRVFVAEVRRRDMEVALDFAVQCSPDHPWLKQHPEWFEHRPDGTIKYAENPPKKYQDIVNLNFHGPHREALWNALRGVVLFWAEQGVRVFRVDNPHTKPVPFWEWLIREVQDRHPDVLFLAEAFTRPPMLKMLAKVGFGQSYTYFTWRNSKGELAEYFTELARGECSEYLRPNLFANTPDILPEFLQAGGRAAFRIRLALAATLSGVYGVYNGFELCEARAIPGTEEYADSEKYRYKVWDWDRPGHIKDDIAALNRIRRDNPALHQLKNLRFYPASGDHVLFYGKATAERGNIVFVAVNLDPFEVHEADLEFPLDDLGIAAREPFEVEELLGGARHLWRDAIQRIRLDPALNPVAIFRVKSGEA